MKNITITFGIIAVLIFQIENFYPPLLIEKVYAELQSVEFDKEQYSSEETTFIEFIGLNQELDPDLRRRIGKGFFFYRHNGNWGYFCWDRNRTEIFMGEIILTVTNESSADRLCVLFVDSITVTVNGISGDADILSKVIFAVIGDYGYIRDDV